jgi:hypothetical protein
VVIGSGPDNIQPTEQVVQPGVFPMQDGSMSERIVVRNEVNLGSVCSRVFQNQGPTGGEVPVQ